VGGLWVRLGKIKCAAICVGLCGCIAALLILRSVGILVVFLSVYVSTVGRPTLACNVPQLQEVGDLEALNCLPPQNLTRSTKLQLTTEPPISCRCC